MMKHIQIHPSRTGLLAAAAATILLAGCTPGSDATPSSATSTGSTARTAQGFAQFPDIAVPAGAKMDVERSLVLGARDDWIGRLSMSVSSGSSQSYDFFQREMPKFGWQEITTVRSEVSVLTFSRNSRVATIQIRNRTLGGAAVDITVSPRGRPPGTAMPASPAGAVDAVPQR